MGINWPTALSVLESYFLFLVLNYILTYIQLEFITKFFGFYGRVKFQVKFTGQGRVLEWQAGLLTSIKTLNINKKKNQIVLGDLRTL